MRDCSLTLPGITTIKLYYGVFAFVIVIDFALTSNTPSEGSFLARKPTTEQDIIALFKAHVDNKLCPQSYICNNRTDMTHVNVNSHLAQCCKDCFCDEKCEFYNDCCFSDLTEKERHE
ncbi:hypothetical protein DPMN_043537 [Dreissena polymorpha]|uniref:Uncharacterized protein n=1 Tax=Dreissena polymorpha TaxID=45954 RepID=A0A9D4HZQ9_DREPO|nr:hypothetical protein DPMN_043537 [Dreissena polymorpha]